MKQTLHAADSFPTLGDLARFDGSQNLLASCVALKNPDGSRPACRTSPAASSYRSEGSAVQRIVNRGMCG